MASRTRLRGRFAKVRNQETRTKIERSVKAFPRDSHRNNDTFGYYNRTHLATFKEIAVPTQAIRGSKVPLSSVRFRKPGKEDGSMEGMASLSAPLCVTRCGMPPASNLHLRSKQATGGSGLPETDEARTNTVAAECPEPRAAIPDLHPQPRRPRPPLSRRGFVHRNMGYSADLSFTRDLNLTN